MACTRVRNILVFTPILRLEPETVEAIFSLEWDGPISFLLQRDNPTGEGHADHLHQYQRGREIFLNGPYDAMLVVESDIIPPPDALTRLAALEADCAYGVYRFRVSNVINIFELYPGKPRNVGESLSLHPRKLRSAVKAGSTSCAGAGFGCVLIKRRVLEKVPFRMEWPENGGHCDSYFCTDVLRAGFTQKADMNVICGHKHENGEILWPEL